MANGDTQMKKLPQVSTNTITRIRWSPKDLVVLTSSYDCSLRLYDAQACSTKVIIRRKPPILDCSFFGPTKALSGDLEGTLSAYDLEKEVETTNTIAHDGAIRCIEVLQRQNKIYTGGVDKMVKLWDQNVKDSVASVSVGSKVLCMDASSQKVVIGCSDNTISVFDVRKFDAPILAREPMKSELRSVKCFPDQSGFVCGSVEGRVAWEYFDAAHSAKNFVFKCHRQKDKSTGNETIYSVNTIGFHHKTTFATGGGDGVVNMWDGITKSKLWRTPNFENPVTSLEFSPDATHLAIATSYEQDQGDKEKEKGIRPSPEIWIRAVSPESKSSSKDDSEKQESEEKRQRRA